MIRRPYLPFPVLAAFASMAAWGTASSIEPVPFFRVPAHVDESARELTAQDVERIEAARVKRARRAARVGR